MPVARRAAMRAGGAALSGPVPAAGAGCWGSRIHPSRYRGTPTHARASATKAILTMVASMPRRAPMPPHTPAITRSVLDLTGQPARVGAMQR